MALHSRCSSVHSSIFMTPLAGKAPCHTGSSTNDLMRASTTSNTERPQHSRSRVNRSPSLAMSACYNTTQVASMHHKQGSYKIRGGVARLSHRAYSVVNWKSAQVVNSHLVCDPTIRQPGFDLPRQQWSLPFSHGTGTLRCLQKEMATIRH